MNKKEASAKQENMVADYMGWRVVSGSGSRPFAPGDVKNEHYLVECKTHTSPQNNIVFYRKHWDKIANEARSVNKYPALIVDDGTQKADHTWVAIRRGSIPLGHINNISEVIQLNTTRSGNTITYKISDLDSLYKVCYYDTHVVNFLGEKFGEDQLAIMPLEEFKKFYEEQFEC